MTVYLAGKKKNFYFFSTHTVYKVPSLCSLHVVNVILVNMYVYIYARSSVYEVYFLSLYTHLHTFRHTFSIIIYIKPITSSSLLFDVFLGFFLACNEKWHFFHKWRCFYCLFLLSYKNTIIVLFSNVRFTPRALKLSTICFCSIAKMYFFSRKKKQCWKGRRWNIHKNGENILEYVKGILLQDFMPVVFFFNEWVTKIVLPRVRRDIRINNWP
jgi:hypothetical protein